MAQSRTALSLISQEGSGTYNGALEEVHIKTADRRRDGMRSAGRETGEAISKVCYTFIEEKIYRCIKEA